MTAFLGELELRRVRDAAPDGLVARGYFLGQGNPPIEILLLDAAAAPRPALLRGVWKARVNGRATPVLAVALCGGTAWLCGPAGDNPPIRPIEIAQAERLCRRALAEPDRNAALRFLQDALPGIEAGVPGLRNEGLLAEHVLLHPERDARLDLAGATMHGIAALGAKDTELLHRLGFGVEKLDHVTNVLRAGDQKRAVAVLLDAREVPEVASARFQRLSPVSWALDRADREGLPWVVLVQQDRVRLYPVALGIGVGRRGRTETWIELRTDLMRQDQAALLWLVFSAEALRAGGTVEALLKASKDFAADLADRLRERIYDRVVPILAAGIAKARGLERPTVEDLRLTYSMALTVLFRLLFIAYAEDRGFLPYNANEAYRRYALKTLARRLHEGQAAAPGTLMWQEVGALCDAVRDGNAAWDVPAYGGGLFEADPVISPPGAALAGIVLGDAVFEPALRALLLDETRDLGAPSAGPVDFRSLRVREFGTIYEGLLGSELAVAERDLALKKQGKEEVYLPAKGREDVRVPAGGIYLHNRSGARKSSGSYFTPGFAVDHLLDAALEPALVAHAARIAALEDDAEAAEAFFDIRIADIAMGSGHFLVAAVDRVEKVLTAILVERTLPGVKAELAALRAAAEAALGALAGTVPIADAQLLRRLIARRCIYGVDLNPLAVDLARLSVWIHSFVPGLPLSLLDRTLVQGNALVGIATVGQLRERFAAAGQALFPVDAHNLLGDAAAPLQRLAKLADATTKDIAAGREAMEQARLAVGPTKALCDLVVAERVGAERVAFQFEHWPRERERIQSNPALIRARAAMAGLHVFHFPVAFPEVFLRRRPGFDVILGNPPWEKVKVEEHAFWARHFPGLRGLAAKEREARIKRLPKERPDLVAEYKVEAAATDRLRAVLGGGLFPGMGTGDPDLYKAFAWRFWQLAGERGGRFGVVLPRSALSAQGSETLRRAVFEGSEAVEVATVTNRGGWVFEEVHQQFTIALLTVARGTPHEGSVAIRGPFATRAAWDAGMARPAQRFGKASVLSWTSSASIPLLPSEASLGVFVQLRKAPRLDANRPGEWRARPDTELHATGKKGLMTFNPRSAELLWPVMKGESFDIWENDFGAESYYAWADPTPVTTELQARRLRGARSARGSRHAEFTIDHLRNPGTLPCNRARIAIRDVSRATDVRTVRAALLPPRVFCAHQAPYFLWPSGDAADETFLLGVLCSVPLDWYARRFVENHLTYFVLNPFPIPRPPRTDPHWQRAVALAGRLACPDDRFADWAASVGVAHGPLSPDEKKTKIEELDAVVARLYGLTAPQLAHIFDTFHEWKRPAEALAWTARRDRTLALLRDLP